MGMKGDALGGGDGVCGGAMGVLRRFDVGVELS